MSWRPFEEAREFARGLHLRSGGEWKDSGRSGYPSDIPSNPNLVYADQGWAGYGDWLGTGNIKPSLRQFLPFEDARSFVRGLGFKNGSEWKAFCKGKVPEQNKLPTNIPTNPNLFYSDKGWIGWGDWLGTGNIGTHFRLHRPFNEARDFVQSLGLKSGAEWRMFCRGDLVEKGRLPSDIPAGPSSVYANKGWTGWGDWLGTGSLAPSQMQFLPFKDARIYVRGLVLKSQTEWRKLCKGELPNMSDLPSNIPRDPSGTYAKSGWVGYGDWLGTENVAPRLLRYRPFREARAFVRNLVLKNGDEWNKFCKGDLPEKGTLPMDISGSPHRTYSDQGWLGMGDWLGTETVATFRRQYRPFEEARAFVRELGLRSGAEWKEFRRGNLPDKGILPSDIPADPQGAYAGKGWDGWGDWLGTGTVSPRLRHYREFDQARVFARSLEFKNSDEWKEYSRGSLLGKSVLPSDIPARPDNTYSKTGWNGWGDWLGTGSIGPGLRQFRPFKEARAFVHGLCLKSGAEWNEFCKGNMPEKGLLPSDIPSHPNKTYSEKGWVGRGDWLGTGTIAPRLRQYRAFQEARDFARSLGINGDAEWKAFCKGKMPEKGALPSDISASPHKTYANKGWAGMGDWLGTGRTRVSKSAKRKST